MRFGWRVQGSRFLTAKRTIVQWVALFNLKIPSRFAPVSSGCDKALQTPPDVSLEAGAWIVGDETETLSKSGVLGV